MGSHLVRFERPVEGPLHRRMRRTSAWLAAFGAALAAYMLFEAQWLARRETMLVVPGLPPGLAGLSILHLSDVHGDQPGLNLWTLKKALRWAGPRQPDLVVVTGDLVSGTGARSQRCLELVGSLRPRLGTYAVPGNHEYGLSKSPFSHRPTSMDWEAAGITLLRDRCVAVPVPGANGTCLAVCGADYVTGGHSLAEEPIRPHDFPLLLVHRPPAPDDPLAERFPLAFAGHTHGGQIRVPTPTGPTSLHLEGLPYIQGVHRWGQGLLAISAGIGTSFLPFRLLTRPEISLYYLAAGSSNDATQA